MGLMEDFYDICTLTMKLDFDGKILQKAIGQPFKQRNAIIPVEIPVTLPKNLSARRDSY
jgi:hypothetical protein